MATKPDHMTQEEWRTRPSTFGQPLQPLPTAPVWDWERAIIDATEGDWTGYKFIGKLREHKQKYPTFQEDRVAEMFLSAEPKTRAYYCYQPVSMFTKSIHKSASYRSLADSQS